MSLHVYCPNKDKGCEWKGEVNAITGHLDDKDGCHFQEIDCPNHCGVAYQQQNLTSHVETECPRHKVNCQYCHDTGEHQFIEGQHKRTCPKLPFPCPNFCEIGKIPRDELTEHINICPQDMIKCKYHIVGCEAVMSRKDQKEHNKEMMEEHLSLSVTELAVTKANQQMTLEKLTIAEKEIADLKQQVFALTDSSEGLQHLPVVVRMFEFTEKKRQKVKWFSDPFYSDSNGYKMQLCVFPNGDGVGGGSHMSVCLCNMKGRNDDDLRWPMTGRFEVTLLNQNSETMHHSVTEPMICRDKPTIRRKMYASWYSSKFISLEAIKGFLEDDSICLQVCKVDSYKGSW